MDADEINRKKRNEVKKFGASDKKIFCIPLENPERIRRGSKRCKGRARNG